MSEIELFRFPVTGQDVRSILIDSNPWFVGKDAATILAYANTRKALKDHVPARHRGSNETFPLAELGLDPQTVLISEAGLYRLIMRSKTTVAEQFQEWVTNDVLPSIRKTGAYAVAGAAPAAIPEDYSAALRRLADAVDAQALAEKERDEMRPLAEAYSQFMETDGTFEWAAVAQILTRVTGGLGRNQLLDLLRNLKVLKDNNTPYQANYEPYFLLVPGGHGVKTTRVTPRGLDWLRQRLVKHFNHQPGLFAIGEIA